ncbi:MAG: flagellar motor switch protein FliN [Desulfohalobiaceae bacterium]
MAKDKDQKNDVDQDKLAEEWAAALAEQEGQDQEKSNDTQPDLDQEWAQAFAEEEEERLQEEKKSKPDPGRVQDYQFQELDNEPQKSTQKAKRDMEFILDIPLHVSAELGRSKLLINDLLQLGQGSVIELDKLAGEPLEVLVNGKLVARGEAVVINEKFGVRLTDIISPMERVKQLG